MSIKLVDILSRLIHKQLSDKSDYLKMFTRLDTGPEEWFRVEILKALSCTTKIEILSTNQKYESVDGRPDFVFKVENDVFIVELKVLPVDRNYNSGYQRFCAGKTNKADFDHLSNGYRDLVIYVHWPHREDFFQCLDKLKNRYTVKCYLEQYFQFGNSACTISYWLRNV